MDMEGNTYMYEPVFDGPEKLFVTAVKVVVYHPASWPAGRLFAPRYKILALDARFGADNEIYHQISIDSLDVKRRTVFSEKLAVVDNNSLWRRQHDRGNDADEDILRAARFEAYGRDRAPR